MFLLSGPTSFISSCGPQVLDVVFGKGLAKGTRLQGKAEKLQKKDEAINICEEYIKNIN